MIVWGLWVLRRLRWVNVGRNIHVFWLRWTIHGTGFIVKVWNVVGHWWIHLIACVVLISKLGRVTVYPWLVHHHSRFIVVFIEILITPFDVFWITCIILLGITLVFSVHFCYFFFMSFLIAFSCTISHQFFLHSFSNASSILLKSLIYLSFLMNSRQFCVFFRVNISLSV